MAIIYSYPEKTSPAGGDFLVITDSEQPAPNKNRTKSLTIDNLANYVVTSVDAVTGSGTTHTLPVWTDGPNGVLGDSMITQNSGGSIATVAGRLAVNTDLSVTGYARFNGQVQDGSNSPGTTGQVLTSTGAGVAWDDATDVVSGAVAKLIPFQVTASAGGSSTYSADNNIVEIGWTGGNGTYVLNIPSAATIPYRNIRFVTNSTFPNGASDKVRITAQPGETIDGNAFFEISKVYEGISIWSNGTEWIIIQAKAH